MFIRILCVAAFLAGVLAACRPREERHAVADDAICVRIGRSNP